MQSAGTGSETSDGVLRQYITALRLQQHGNLSEHEGEMVEVVFVKDLFVFLVKCFQKAYFSTSSQLALDYQPQPHIIFDRWYLL